MCTAFSTIFSQGKSIEGCQRFRILPEDDHDQPGCRQEVTHGCCIRDPGIAVGKDNAEIAVAFFLDNLLDAFFKNLRLRQVVFLRVRYFQQVQDCGVAGGMDRGTTLPEW